jgi:uncharacterized membrane protein YhdT
MDSKTRNKWALLLLLLPYLAVLWVPAYNKADPELLGILGMPFFYGYQLLWVVVCSVIVGIVFKLTRADSHQ